MSSFRRGCELAPVAALPDAHIAPTEELGRQTEAPRAASA